MEGLVYLNKKEANNVGFFFVLLRQDRLDRITQRQGIDQDPIGCSSADLLQGTRIIGKLLSVARRKHFRGKRGVLFFCRSQTVGLVIAQNQLAVGIGIKQVDNTLNG